MSFFLREQPAFASLSAADFEWEECPCLLCGADRAIPLLEAPDRTANSGKWFLVVQCRSCGLCFTNPRPTEASMAQFRAAELPPLKRPILRQASSRARSASRYRKTIAPFGGRRLLDVCCGSGNFLRRMREAGWMVQGLDSSAEVTQRLRDDFGLPAITGALPHGLLEDGSFDAITMWQSLQLVRWPLATLRAVRQLLAPGGTLIIAVPNMDSLPFRLFGQAWSGLNLPRHLTHFTPWTLEVMLRRAGFRHGPMHMIRRGRWLRASAKLACGQRAEPPAMYRWLRKKTAADLATWYGFLTRQSDCIMVTATVD